MKTGSYALAVATLGATLVGVTGCKPAKKKQAKVKKPSRVEVTVARKVRLVESLETTGDVVAVNTVTLQATVEGPIAYCPWREGDRIEKAGQKLIEINRPLYRGELSATEAVLAVASAKLADLKAGTRPEEIAQARESVRNLEGCTEFAKADLGRTQSLVESGSLPAEMVEKARVSHIKCQTQLQAAKEKLAMLIAGPTKTEIAIQQAAVDEADAKRALAQAKIDECLLKAPFAGVITQVLVRPGDLAIPRAPLLKMMDPSSLIVQAGLPENCAANIHKGTEVSVQLDAYPRKTFKGKIERVHPRLEWNTRTRIIEVRIIDPVELIPRLFARLSVRGRVVEDAVVVPDAAIVTTPRGNKVVFVIQDGKAVKRVVTIGLEQGTLVQIVEGVQIGDQVVVVGNLNLKNGVKIRLGKPVDGSGKNKSPNAPGKGKATGDEVK
ncbi:MAG: efflux RND transporter periplasmic adaptor subunit [Lentisphaeria bacterium]|nr:efflux RND transporter periplasmic adaptor subunit [Lentisphaeria bacterium]